ncbi:MAG: aminotransferase class V-fold PLP-dependent enzyme [Sulfolobaceae archaeon]|nr:aminotransferase class V-fold PLP-dependent enzyme [Sulfolobaceae archaeon]
MKYLTPGPVQIPKEIIANIAKQPIFHRTDEFREIFARVTSKLDKIIHGTSIILPGTGTLAVDTIVYNYVDPGDNVLLIVIGEFSERMGDSLIARGAKVTKLQWNTGSVPSPDIIEDYAKKIKDLKAIALVHNETSLGVANRYIEKIQEIASSLGATLLVDSVSGIPAEPIYGKVDAIATASHKAFLSPPGASIIFINKKPTAKAQVPPAINLNKFIKYREKNDVPYTPPMNVLYALDASTDYILKLGVTNYADIHRERAETIYNLIKLEPVAEEKFRSNTVTAFYTNHAKEILSELKRNGYVISLGMGELAEKVIRIGIMGDINYEDLKNVAEVVNKYVDR